MDGSIKIELPLVELNYILEALADKPYREVFDIIRKIKEQAEPQVQEN